MNVLIFIPWIVVGFGCWIGYHLLRQNGRILLRLESLEQQLRESRLAGAQRTQAAPAVPAALQLGSAAPSFELPDLVGRRRKLSEWRGRRVLLIFFNPNCGFCVRMMPDLLGLPQHRLGAAPLLITTGDPLENQKFFDEYGLPGPVLLQKQMEVASSYKVSGTPVGYLVDEEGKIASEMAVGAQALLALAGESGVPQLKAAGNGLPATGTGNTGSNHNHDLSRSRINRAGLKAGTSAPAFHLPLLNGGELSLADFRGRKVLLVFSDPGCGPCQVLAPKLNAFYTENRRVQIIIISRGDSEANRSKAAEQQLTFPIALQRQWEISRLYGMFATPMGYLIDEEGVIEAEVAVGVEAILALLYGKSALLEPSTVSR